MYNTLYTFLPVLIYSITEQNISSDKLIEQPKLYTRYFRLDLMDPHTILQIQL